MGIEIRYKYKNKISEQFTLKRSEIQQKSKLTLKLMKLVKPK